MEGEAESSRPESPKKKIKSNPVSDSEAQPSSYSNSDSAGSSHVNSHVNGICPNRDGRFKASTPDSSSEARVDENQNKSPPRVQEEEVSSSENSVSKGKTFGSFMDAGDADSVSKESEQSFLVCDSVSSDSFASESNDKN